jgi:hypothetical protein
MHIRRWRSQRSKFQVATTHPAASHSGAVPLLKIANLLHDDFSSHTRVAVSLFLVSDKRLPIIGTGIVEGLVK